MADVMAVPAADEEVRLLGYEARFDDSDEGEEWDGNGADPDWEEDEDDWEDDEEEDEWEEDDDWEEDDEWEDDEQDEDE
jgi:segregation and condensation protein B